MKPEVIQTRSTLGFSDWWTHLKARLGFNRMGHLVEPGLYSLGAPNKASPVFVTANYTLSFDALRSALGGIDCYIMVLNTKGVNVWCAAGKGTFVTGELADKIESTQLDKVVAHKTVILPQLGASGVAAHLVKKQTGFKVEYGPVLALDLPKYLVSHQATPEMRKVQFPLLDRIVLIPIEVKAAILPLSAVCAVIFFAVGAIPAIGLFICALAGILLFPMLLPIIPGRDFSAKGALLGALISAPFVLTSIAAADTPIWERIVIAVFFLLAVPSATAFFALNFTGATTFASPSMARREIFRYVPVMVWSFGIAVIPGVARTLFLLFGGA